MTDSLASIVFFAIASIVVGVLAVYAWLVFVVLRRMRRSDPERYARFQMITNAGKRKKRR